jgi:hypothetical protein
LVRQESREMDSTRLLVGQETREMEQDRVIGGPEMKGDGTEQYN